MTAWLRRLFIRRRAHSDSRAVARPVLEILEDRRLLSAAAANFVAGAKDPSQVLCDLATHRWWIDYAPSGFPGFPFNPNFGLANDVSTTQITNDLAELNMEGWKGLITYSMVGNLQFVPSIAKTTAGLHFQHVFVGISNTTVATWDTSTGGWTGGTAPQEYQNLFLATNLPYIDAIVVGNEGLTVGPVNYSFGQLVGVMTQLRADLQAHGDTKTLVSTTDVGGTVYLPPSTGNGNPLSQAQWEQFIGLSDFQFPNADHFNGGPSNIHGDINAAVTTIGNEYYGILDQINNNPNTRPYFHKLLVFKESFWPHAVLDSNNVLQDTSADQKTFYQDLANKIVQGDLGPSPVFFCWGEAFDQYWKQEPNKLGPYWGFHTTNPTSDPDNPSRTPVTIVKDNGGLRNVFQGAYPQMPPNFNCATGGNIKAAINRGVLTLTGDTRGNGVRLEAGLGGPGSIRLTGLDGTTIDGQSGTIQLYGFTSGLKIQLGQGEDVVQFQGLTIMGPVSCNLGGGADRIIATDSLFSGRWQYAGGTGNDRVDLMGSHFLGPVLLGMGYGTDLVFATGSQFNNDVLYVGGIGRDILDAGIANGNQYGKSFKQRMFESRLS